MIEKSPAEGRRHRQPCEGHIRGGDLILGGRLQEIISDDVFARVLTFPNVLVAGRHGFFMVEAFGTIEPVVLANVSAFEATGRPVNPVSSPGRRSTESYP